MSVSVIIPFHGEDPHRVKSLKFVLQFYKSNFPNWQVILANDDHEFNKAKLINHTVRKIKDNNVVILNDADSLVASPSQILKASLKALNSPGLVFAYTRYCRISKEVTENIHNTNLILPLNDKDFELMILNSPSHGCVAIRRDCFLEVGGLDEEFLACYFEDNAFNLVCEKKWPHRRINGDLLHLWHERNEGPENPYWVKNLERFQMVYGG